MTRKLTLKKESLTALSDGELASVAGGNTLVCAATVAVKECDGYTLPLAYCLTFAGSRCIY